MAFVNGGGWLRLGAPSKAAALRFSARRIRPSVKATVWRGCVRGAMESPQEDLVVIAVGGNALLKRGEPMTDDNERRNVQAAAESIAEVVEAGYRVCVTHGNGPQVGLLSMVLPASDLDILDAQTAGSIGYLIDSELSNILGDDRTVATLVTQTLVHDDDPAFKNPTKFIGPQYDEDQHIRDSDNLLPFEGREADEAVDLVGTCLRAQVAKMQRRGYVVRKDGNRWRRVVASPSPLDILESEAIRILLRNDVTVVCAGGGGIPVVVRNNQRHGVEAVVDKDLASQVLARELGAKYLLILTDVPGLYRPDDFGGPRAQPLGRVSAEDLKRHAAEFPAGSMRPKVEAAVRFASTTPSGMCGIGDLQDALRILEGKAGTRIQASGQTDVDGDSLDHAWLSPSADAQEGSLSVEA